MDTGPVQETVVPSHSRWMEHSGEGAKECTARRRVTKVEEERRRMPSLLPMSVGVGGRPDMGTRFSYLVLGSMDRHTWSLRVTPFSKALAYKVSHSCVYSKMSWPTE